MSLFDVSTRLDELAAEMRSACDKDPSLDKMLRPVIDRIQREADVIDACAWTLDDLDDDDDDMPSQPGLAAPGGGTQH